MSRKTEFLMIETSERIRWKSPKLSSLYISHYFKVQKNNLKDPLYFCNLNLNVCVIITRVTKAGSNSILNSLIATLKTLYLSALDVDSHFQSPCLKKLCWCVCWRSNRKPLVNPERQTMSLLRTAINIAEIFFYWGENKAGSSSCCYCHHQLGLKAEGAGPWKQGWVTSVSQSCKLYSNSSFLFLSLNMYLTFCY